MNKEWKYPSHTGIHPTVELDINGKKVLVDEEVAQLVDSINKFRKDNKQQFETIESEQEDLPCKYDVGGESWIQLRYKTPKSKQYLNKILDNSAKILSKDGTCNLELKYNYVLKNDYGEELPKIVIDCNITNNRNIFESERKKALKILKDNFDQFST